MHQEVMGLSHEQIGPKISEKLKSINWPKRIQKVYFTTKKCNFTSCQVYIPTIFKMKMQKIEEMSSTHYTVRV